jgi:hypothetical protein
VFSFSKITHERYLIKVTHPIEYAFLLFSGVIRFSTFSFALSTAHQTCSFHSETFCHTTSQVLSIFQVIDSATVLALSHTLFNSSLSLLYPIIHQIVHQIIHNTIPPTHHLNDFFVFFQNHSSLTSFSDSSTQLCNQTNIHHITGIFFSFSLKAVFISCFFFSTFSSTFVLALSTRDLSSSFLYFSINHFK